MYKIPTSIVVCICSILYLNQQSEYKSTINLKLLYLQVCKRNTTFARKLDIKRLILTFIYSNLLHCTKESWEQNMQSIKDNFLFLKI